MTSARLEKRVAALEAELARLKKKVEGSGGAEPWWERIAGTFRGDPVYRQAMKLGRQYRRSTNPSAKRRKPT